MFTVQCTPWIMHTVRDLVGWCGQFYVHDVIKWKYFCVTGPLLMESTGRWWIYLTKANVAELWCFLWSTPEETVEQTLKTLVIWDATMYSLWRHCNELPGSSTTYCRRLIYLTVGVEFRNEIVPTWQMISDIQCMLLNHSTYITIITNACGIKIY